MSEFAALRYDTVTFLSDYGRIDEFVGVVHSVIRQMAPGVSIVDLTHDVPAYDVRSAGLTLARSAQYVCPGVVLAVVDPGVGTPRRPIAVEVAGGRAVLVGPDNGLLAPAVGMIGGAERAVELDRPEYHLEAPGPTFAGRDVFAPVVAHLCMGVPLEEVGSLVDTTTLMPGTLPLTHAEGDQLTCEVLWIDRFGNVQLNVDPDELDGWGDRMSVTVAERTRTARRAATYAEIAVSEIGMVIDSYGMVSLAANRASAAEVLRLVEADEVRLERLPDDDADDAGGAAISTAVSLGRRPAPPEPPPAGE